MAIRKGTKVRWKWGSSWAEGTVEEVRHEDVSRTSHGEEVTRHGTDDDPALVITQDDGTLVLKLEHEVERALEPEPRGLGAGHGHARGDVICSRSRRSSASCRATCTSAAS